MALVVTGADVFLRGLLVLAARLRFPAFVVTVVLPGFELESLAAGIAANAKGLPGVSRLYRGLAGAAA